MAPNRIPEWTKRQMGLLQQAMARGDSRPCKPSATLQTAGSGSDMKYICVRHDRMYSVPLGRCAYPGEGRRNRSSMTERMNQ